MSSVDIVFEENSCAVIRVDLETTLGQLKDNLKATSLSSVDLLSDRINRTVLIGQWGRFERSTGRREDSDVSLESFLTLLTFFTRHFIFWHNL